MEQSEKVNDLEKDFAAHEVMCEERWKTCFQRLSDVEEALRRIESRMMAIGGTMTLFLGGVIVTLLTKMQEKHMPYHTGKKKKKPMKKNGKKKKGLTAKQKKLPMALQKAILKRKRGKR